MLKIKTALLDLAYIEEAAEHYAGRSACDVAVLETANVGRQLPNGQTQGASVYAFVWTGQALRRANDLEAYRFRNV